MTIKCPACECEISENGTQLIKRSAYIEELESLEKTVETLEQRVKVAEAKAAAPAPAPAPKKTRKEKKVNVEKQAGPAAGPEPEPPVAGKLGKPWFRK